MKKTKKHIWLAIIAIIIAALAFGYAYLTTTLSINGITDIDRNSWDVYFDNVQVTQGSVTGEQEIEAPTITSDTEVEFHVNLKKPGDFYEFTIEARNDGTIDAMINSVSKKLNGTEITTLPSYLNYTVTYEDDIEIEDNHLLAAESLETYKVRIEYKSNISATDLPSTAQSLTLSFGVEYVQADDNVTNVREEIFETTGGFTIGSSIPTGITTYNTYQEAITAYGSGYFFMHKVADEIITQSYIGFILNENVYYLRGGDNGSNFENNKAILQTAFGEANCFENTGFYACENSTNRLSANIDDDGYAMITKNCTAYSIGVNGSTSIGSSPLC